MSRFGKGFMTVLPLVLHLVLLAGVASFTVHSVRRQESGCAKGGSLGCQGL